ncbi:MAG: hypothetical protein KGI69_01530 [Patescibacteria group bacterium]|nr:hypothetical protein [Patescibacteria group bacterium]
MDPAIIVALAALVVAAIAFICVIVQGAARRKRKRAAGRPAAGLSRHARNPLISPQPHVEWESEGTFNPAAVCDDEGTVHLFYRAIGGDGISRIGYARSPDGLDVSYRSPFPVFNPQPGFGMPDPMRVPGPHGYDIAEHPSGGGWGGAEDPRAVRIGDRVYMTYMAFEGWESMRIAVTSIGLDDLKRRRWAWKRPVLISPARKRNKNWVLFPEKIRGKFAILHGLSPKVLIDYVDSVDDFFGKRQIDSASDHGGWGYADPGRAGHWDRRMRGTGSPPIRTGLGWLVLYHAFDERDPRKAVGYSVGALVLDPDEPTRVLYRSPEPILLPEAPYENDGKPGVVYASGAVVKDGMLHVYYGGGDKHVCAARTPLRSLLDWLAAYGAV